MRRSLLALALVGLLAGCGGTAVAAPSADPQTGLGRVDESALDSQEAHTLAEVRDGPPYDYPRNDGVTYHNNNGDLPREPDGFYREFTVRTPGESTRGPRRIVAGRDGRDYLTVDHYDTFREIRLGS